jgi:hypothetical protein
LVKHRPKTVDVSGAADCSVISHRLFRRHVTWRAQNFQCARNGAFTLDQPRKAKVGQVRFAFAIEQDVSRFDVTMKNPVLVCVMNRARDFRD